MRRLRLFLTGSPATGLNDVLTGRPPALWDADGLTVQVYLRDLENLNDDKAPFDISTIAAGGLTLEIRESPTDADPLVLPIEPDDALEECTFENWKLVG